MSERCTYLAVLAAVGCILVPAVSRADVRIEERSTALDSTVTRWIAIKADKRSIVTRAQTTGVLYNVGGRYGALVEIARPDRDLIWQLDPQERSYREITAAQFTRTLQKGVQAPRNPNEQPLRTLYRSETTAIEVAPTGRQKQVAGYNAEEVLARVVVGAQNLVSGNKLSYTFDQQFWITKDERLMKEVRGFEDTYIEHFGSAATLQQAELLAGEWSDAFITHLRAVNDRVRALGGFPLSVTTTVTEEALAQAKNEKGTSRQLSVASTEVRSVSLETVSETEFELPVGYINQDTKVAVAPRPADVTPAAPTVTVAKVPETPAPAPAPMPVVAAAPKPAPAPVAAAPAPAAPAPVAAAPASPPTAVASAQPAVRPSTVASRGSQAGPAPGTQVASAAPGPAQPEVVAPRPPSNVVVPGVRGSGIFIESYQAPAILNNHAILGGSGGGISSSRDVPPPVTIDEPDTYTDKKSKKTKKRR